MILPRNFDSDVAKAISAAVRPPDSPQDNPTKRGQKPPRLPLRTVPDLMTLANLDKASRIAHFAQTASQRLPLAKLDPLEALLASHPETSSSMRRAAHTPKSRSPASTPRSGKDPLTPFQP
ncbi:uncharacterized protein STAUR_1476 [Stigmatella aurantiaca DW4/3-1]|uniref:Uncharacterized protein n=1 Tax=Stigmatella aurantiaca (strain DW4/3-1) TaxID=378806 RepID=E3FM81_STIAD|nr:uncharacterized protein STAUR_1476 [Stigmatella aurantiaca DW4/3-1]